MEDNKSNTTKLSEWLAYYQILIGDVKYAKSQQWQLTYYILLLLGVIIGLFKALGQSSEVKIILFLTAFGLSCFGTHLLFKFQKDLRRYRKNIKNVRSYFPDDLKEIATYKPAEEDPSYYVNVLYLIVGVIWSGVIFVGWVIGFWSLLFCK